MIDKSKPLPPGLHRDTLAVRTALPASQWGENSEALYLTSGFVQPDAETSASRFANPQEGYTYGRTVEEVREIIGCDALIYQDVEGMKRAVAAATAPGARKLDGFDASCFDGVYVTGDINADDIARINEARIGQEDPLEESTSRLALPNAQEA